MLPAYKPKFAEVANTTKQFWQAGECCHLAVSGLEVNLGWM
jgi:hypothetical protein